MAVESTRTHPLASDLDAILSRSAENWNKLRGARLFVTGGTGFVGTWLLESFAWANRAMTLDASAVVLTRDPENFAAKAPHLATDSAISLLCGDVMDQNSLPEGPFTHVVHAAAESNIRQAKANPLHSIETIVRGTGNVLDAARAWGVRSLLFTSSGAVYGPQPRDMALMSEEYLGGPNQLSAGSAYAEAKRLAETLCATYAAEFQVPVKIARCFAFIGPYLPLEAQFAAGNFMRDVLAGDTIVIRGDGKPVRSYLYASDLASWLWTILGNGQPGRAYNVGSERGLTIAELARIIATSHDPASSVSTEGIADPDGMGGGDLYVPSTRRAREELGLRESVSLSHAVTRTMRWHRNRVPA